MVCVINKLILTENRKRWPDGKVKEFEKAYGTYLYVPLDVPKFIINDIEKFKDFHNKCGVIAETVEDKTYDEAEMWAQNNYDQKIVTSSYTKLIKKIAPELIEQFMEYFSFINPEFNDWCIWSTRTDIHRHRDQAPLIDAPATLRIMLYDDNPVQTLKLTLDPIGKKVDYDFYLDLPDDTNSFTWNNLRAQHDSVYIPNHSKLLWIFSQKIDPYFIYDDRLNKYIDLLDRSIAKYKSYIKIDTLTTIDDYLEIEK